MAHFQQEDTFAPQEPILFSKTAHVSHRPHRTPAHDTHSVASEKEFDIS